MAHHPQYREHSEANSRLVYKVNSMQTAESRQRVTVPLPMNRNTRPECPTSAACLGATSLESGKAVLRMSVKVPGEGWRAVGEGRQEARCLSLSEEQGDQFCSLQNRVGRNFSFKGATMGKKSRKKNLTDAMGGTLRKKTQEWQSAAATLSDSLDPCDV